MQRHLREIILDALFHQAVLVDRPPDAGDAFVEPICPIAWLLRHDRFPDWIETPTPQPQAYPTASDLDQIQRGDVPYGARS
ncbi:MAG: hypothetical protein ROR55_02955 [Devosia sp.]